MTPCIMDADTRIDRDVRSLTDILQEFSFSLEDYLGRGKDRVVAAAVALCRSEGEDGIGLETEVSAFLDRCARQRMQAAAVWSRPWRDIVDGTVVSASFGPETVEAEVSLSPKTIRVRLQRPCSGTSASVRIPRSMPWIFTDEPRKRARASDYGKQRIRELVIDLYLNFLSKRID